MTEATRTEAESKYLDVLSRATGEPSDRFGIIF